MMGMTELERQEYERRRDRTIELIMERCGLRVGDRAAIVRTRPREVVIKLVTRVTPSYIYVEGGTKYERVTGLQYDRLKSGRLRGPVRAEELRALAHGEGAGETPNAGNETERDSPRAGEGKAEGN